MKRTLTVTIPNYNHSHYLPGLFEALLSQSRLPDEIIVVDDCSTDNSVEVIEGFARDHDRIRLIRHETNRGTNGACETALAAVSSEYTYSIGADDLPLPGFHEKHMAMLEANPHAGMSFSLPTFINEHNVVTSAPNAWSESPRFYTPEELPAILEGTHIFGAGAIIKKQSLVDAGGAIAELRWHSDWFYLMTIAFRSGACFIPEGCVAVRTLENSYSSAGMRDRTQQVQVLQAIMRTLLRPEYQDVLPSFIRSRSFNVFGDECIDALTSAPDLWQPSMMMLVQDFFFRWMAKSNPTAIASVASGQPSPMGNLMLRVARLELERANEKLAQGRVQEALNALVELVRTHPDFPDAYGPLCTSLRLAGQHAAADEFSRAASALFPQIGGALGGSST